MKRVKLFSLLLVVVVVASCSKDNSPAPGHEQAVYDVVFNIVTVSANFQVSTSQIKRLTEVLSASNKDKVPYVKGAETQMSSSNIKIQGLTKGSALKTVALNVLDEQGKTVYTYNINLAIAISNETLTDDTNSCMTFISNVNNYLAAKKNINLQIVINGGTEDVSNLKVTLHSSAIFSW